MKYLLNIVHPENKFRAKLEDLFIKFPSVDPNALGMKPGWQQEPLWQN